MSKKVEKNTKFFYLIAFVKHRRKIFQLKQDEVMIVGQENLNVHITEYYKSLFGSASQNNFLIIENENQDIHRLPADFTEKDVFEAFMQMENNK
jgi:hypothetical protein